MVSLWPHFHSAFFKVDGGDLFCDRVYRLDHEKNHLENLQAGKDGFKPADHCVYPRRSIIHYLQQVCSVEPGRPFFETAGRCDDLFHSRRDI